jgi:DNA-binding winged helix-turn-helix (wHTH) protein/tetratricopeptide (TPR) repeat protein
MIHCFGGFSLDESRRELTLRGKAIDIQPKVFDLLVYLVRNAGRVVPKSELLDQVWSHLHVSESSLQRAVSLLRSELRKGSLDHVLKSYSGRGYRFAIDQPDLSGEWPQPDKQLPQVFASIFELATSRRWKEISEILGREKLDTLPLGTLEVWAFAEECLSGPEAAIPVLRRIVELAEQSGNPLSAAKAAITLSKILLERKEIALSRGWLARASNSVAYGDPSIRAYHLWMQSRLKAFEGPPEEASALVNLAAEAAEVSGSPSMRALTLAYQGFYNISLGQTRLGLEQQDHAAALAMSTSVDPITGGLIYCNILWSCRSTSDWSRANQWVDGFETWCENNFACISAACQLHRAEVTGAQATLADALARVNEAIRRLPVAEPWATGDAHRVRGDIHAAIGDLAAAAEDYRKSYELGWDGEPGNAVLLSEAGDHRGAIAAIDRVLVSTDWFTLQRKGMLMAHKARICAIAGETASARACIAAIAQQYETWPSKAVHALVQETEAILRHGEPDKEPSAVQLLNLARQLWTSVGAEFQAARVRLILARSLQQQGDTAGAKVEAHCSELAAAKIGAMKLLASARELLAHFGSERLRSVTDRVEPIQL